MRGIVVFALVGLFLGCALQAVKSREERIQESIDDGYNGIERDEEELAYPDEFNDGDGASVDDADGTDGENDDDEDNLDVDVQPADPFDDDDDDGQNDEELGEYQSEVQEDPRPRPGWFRKIFRRRRLKKVLGRVVRKIRIRYQKRF